MVGKQSHEHDHCFTIKWIWYGLFAGTMGQSTHENVDKISIYEKKFPILAKIRPRSILGLYVQKSQNDIALKSIELTSKRSFLKWRVLQCFCSLIACHSVTRWSITYVTLWPSRDRNRRNLSAGDTSNGRIHIFSCARMLEAYLQKRKIAIISAIARDSAHRHFTARVHTRTRYSLEN